MDHHNGQLCHLPGSYMAKPPPRLIPPNANSTTMTTTTQCSLDRLMSTSKGRRDRVTSSRDTVIHTSSCIDNGYLRLGERLVPECRHNSGHLTTAAAAHMHPINCSPSAPTLPRVGIFIYKLWTTMYQFGCGLGLGVGGLPMGCLSCSDVEHQ
jgi:hypothetical protein